MKLKYVHRINWIVGGVLLVCIAVMFGDFGEQVTMGCLYGSAGLFAALSIFDIIFLRCPHCGATLLFQSPGEFCSTCGGDLRKEKGER